uniref:lytic transglycosylase domain-containing protein n=1 Tax=Nitrospira cf. moscoviensis SBR1015 TaxID=96242 RepID=UPI000B3BC6F6|nr:lytic transglycosylase domain-containing protein [Nitrospira cf. moscoviensis SBR1015]
MHMERSGHNVAFQTPIWPISGAAFPLRCMLVLFLSCVMIAATPLPTKRDYEGSVRYSSQEIRRAIAFYAVRYRLDPDLLRAVIKTESDFRQDVVSHKGAVGLMQLTPDTAATLRVADLHDPLQNIRGGAKQLRHLLNLYEGDLPLALAAYNAGVHRVKGGKIPRIRETRSYVRKVLRHYEHYKGQYRCGQSEGRSSCKSRPGSAPMKQTQATS